MHPYVHGSITYNGQAKEATSVSINRQADKGEVAQTCNGILVSHKKEQNLAICNNMDGPRGD